MKCDQCQLLRINGVVCHEIGCPNSGTVWEDGQWVRYYDCFQCGYPIREGESCDCLEDWHKETKMKYTITQHGDLEISVTQDERNELKANKQNIMSNDYMAEFLEPLIANSELDWILPEEIAALTDAPILGIVDRDNSGQVSKIHKIWWYPDYAISSPLQELMEDGVCVFQVTEEA